MTRDHLTSEELAAYHERRLPAATTLAASDHIAACEECRARLLQLGGPEMSAAARDDLSYEELTGWLDNSLDPLTRREVAATLEHSARARAALADLARFRDETNDLPAHDHTTSRRSFPQWVLGVAAALVLSSAAIWWTTSRKAVSSNLVKLRDGDRVIAFASDGRAAILRDLPEPISAAVAETLRAGRIEVAPEIAALAGEAGTLAGGAEEQSRLRVLQPVGAAVREARPQFRWAAEPAATAYQINIMEETSGDLVVSEQLAVTATQWQPAAPLPSGQVYQWEVQALRDGAVIANSPKPPEPEARFQILSEAQVAELEEAKRTSNGSHLVMGVANARAGLLDDALGEFQMLREQNPEAELPRRLIEQLEAQRRNYNPPTTTNGAQ